MITAMPQLPRLGWVLVPVRVVAGGIGAAAVTTAIWLGLEDALVTGLAWLACAVGLVTGLAVRHLAGPDACASLTRGAVAAVVTSLAMAVGVAIVASTVEAEKQASTWAATVAQHEDGFKRNSQTQRQPTDILEKPATDKSNQPLVQPAVKIEPRLKPSQKSFASIGGQLPAEPTPHRPMALAVGQPSEAVALSQLLAYLEWWFGSWDTLWLNLSALIAFFLGRGGNVAVWTKKGKTAGIVSLEHAII